MTWAELIRKLKENGFTELRTGRGSHQQFWNPATKKVVTIAAHTKQEIGKGLLNRILKDSGIKDAKEKKKS